MRFLLAAVLLAATPVKVGVLDLVRAYQKNEIGADAKFKDKTLEVDGPVFAVGKAVDGSFFVGLSHDGHWVVQCLLATNDPKAGELETGKRVTVNGRGGGLTRMDGGFNVIFLRDCKLGSTSP